MARKKGRDIDGVVLLDKPVGCSSNAALQRVRRAFDARKAGHTGSLDPLASGLLPVCLGEATKLSSYLLHADKYYRVTAAHGCETTTGDREGDATRRTAVDLPDRAVIEATLARFIGEQQQIPPMYSALKHEGRRLYELARAGHTVARAPRAVRISALRLIERTPETFTLDADVSGGTYIRTLVEDIVKAWGGAAHVASLRRVGVGPLGHDLPLTPLADIETLAEQHSAPALAELLYPLSTVMADWPQAFVDDQAVAALRQGRKAGYTTLAASADDARMLCISGLEGGFFGLGVLDDAGYILPRRIFARTQR